jgi:hypothetical protein
MISRNRMWAAWCRDVCVAQIQVFSDTLERHILPAFEGIEKEADQIQKDQWYLRCLGQNPRASSCLPMFPSTPMVRPRRASNSSGLKCSAILS